MASTFDIPDHYFSQFTSNVELELQRAGSKLLPYVRVESYSGEKAQVVNKYGEVEMTELTTRYSDTEWAEIARTQRWIHPKHYALHMPVDRKDQLKTLYDLQNPLVQAGAMAVGRKQDDVIAAAFFGTAYAGVNGLDSVTWGYDVYGNALTSNTIAVDYVETGSTANSNLTVGKLRKAQEQLTDYEIDLEREMPVVIATSNQRHALLRDTSVTSSDYNAVKALVNGEVNTFMGFRFVWLSKNLVPTDSNSYRRVAVITPGALVAGQWEGMQTRISERADKNHTVQISMYMDFNATRIDEKRILEIKCSEAVL